MDSSNKAKKEFSNMSFKELDNLINLFAASNDDTEYQFLNQMHELNRSVARNSTNDLKCQQLNRLLNLVKHLQAMIELNMLVANENIEKMEAAVLDLERQQEQFVLQEKIDRIRKEVYPIALKLNQELTEIQVVFDDVFKILTDINETFADKSTKFVAKILDHQTIQLNCIDHKIRKIEEVISSLKQTYVSENMHDCTC